MFKTRLIAIAAFVALCSLAGIGCGKKAGIHLVLQPKRPTVDLTAAPVSTADTAFYAYRIDWSGYDEDGRIDHFEYAIDPRPNDTLWVRTPKNEEIVFFRATHAYRTKTGWRSLDPHTFAIRAVDNSGLLSQPKTRSFFSYTIAPTVQISSPLPSAIGTATVTPALRISWTGSDPDGQFTQKPIKYRYKLIQQGGSEFGDLSWDKQNPDSLRRYYAANNFAGWDSTSADTTQVQFVGLTPDKEFLFFVVGIDEAGAYSADWSLYSNILDMQVGFAGTLGPVFICFNEFFFYQYPTGGFTPNNPASWVELEIPAGRRIRFYWIALPPPGAAIEWYRWKLDGDVADETGRTDEAKDWAHWSQKSNLTTFCDIGPFGPDSSRFLYVEAQDNNGLVSLAVIHFTPVKPSFNSELLVVDDTRLEEDQVTATGTLKTYSRQWPARAELDTFFFARGGVPWRRTKQLSPQPFSSPGIFNGYPWDSLGTRLGYEIASAGTPLSLLGKYRHIIWVVDQLGGLYRGGSTSRTDPLSTLHFMCTPGQSNTLSSYALAGGKIWLAGGASAYASLIEFNARGGKDNDKIYGGQQTVFSSSAGELVPGRLMYDFAQWRSEMAVQTVTTSIVRVPDPLLIHPDYANGQGRGFPAGDRGPDYSKIPLAMRRKSLALLDSFPPTRAGAGTGNFYTTGSFAIEYLDQPNEIQENYSSDPAGDSLVSVMDSLYFCLGGSTLATNIQNQGNLPVNMTYYHGRTTQPFVFSGFDLWTWSRQDVKGLVDFVLQDIWHLAPPASQRFTIPGLRAAGPPSSQFRRMPAGAPARGRPPGARIGNRP